MKKIAKEKFEAGLIEGDEVVETIIVEKGDEYEIIETSYIYFYHIIKHKGKLLEVSLYDIA